MNCNMMCRVNSGWGRAALGQKSEDRGWHALLSVLLFLILMAAHSDYAKAQESRLPAADVLIVYSDGADEKTLSNVRSLVELFTWQDISVTFAPAQECLGRLTDYGHIIFYRLDNYPSEIIIQIKEIEQMALEALEDAPKLMFVGSVFLETYLDQTQRRYSYTLNGQNAGRLNYSFHDIMSKDTLVSAEEFLFFSGSLSYVSGIVSLEGEEGYFCARKGVLTHISAGDLQNELVRTAFAAETARWYWDDVSEPPSYGQYMVINKVYPFQDPEKLLRAVRMMSDKKQPFVISVMPIYSNGDYPAMQRFCEVLRYAQAQGGTILIHAPLNRQLEFDVDLVNEYLNKAIHNYVAQGVYPMGIQIPHNWIFDENALEVISRFSTVLISEEEDSSVVTGDDVRSNMVYRDAHQWIAPAIVLDEQGTSYITAYPAAVYFDLFMEPEAYEAKLAACESSPVPLKSLWDDEHSLWTKEDTLSYRNRTITVNKTRIELDGSFEPTEYEEKYAYRRNVLQRYSKDLSSENRKLLAAVLAVSILFCYFIFLARRSNRSRFLYKEDAKTEEKASDGQE